MHDWQKKRKFGWDSKMANGKWLKLKKRTKIK